MKSKLFNKRVIAFALAGLILGTNAIPSIFNVYDTYADFNGTAQAGTNVFWNEAMGPYPGNYYGKIGRKYFGKLKVNGKAAICLDSTKALNTGKTGTIAQYNFDGTQSFPTGISRDGAEMLSYAMIMGGGGNGRQVTDDNYYILCQCLCWMIESKNGNVSWEDLDEWKTETIKLSDYLIPPYNVTVKQTIEKYCENAISMLRPESVSEFMSKYPNEAPILTLDYDESKGIYTKDFELIHYLDAVDKGFSQVWMQYFLDYDAAIAKLEAEGKIDKGTLKIEHHNDDPSSPGRNWIHVEYTGDIEKLKACGPIPLGYKENTDGWKYTYGLQNLSIWTPDDSSQQHLFSDVNYGAWAVYMSFGGGTPGGGNNDGGGGGGEGSYTVTVNTHQHDETFVSNYNIDLYKYDFETGEPLENSEFEILERMDLSQFDDSVDHNGGNPDGTFKLDDLNFDKFSKVKANTEKPTEEWEVCQTQTTDSEGHINHKDVFQYDFTATYCDGHPDPEIEYIECDHDEEDDCDCDEKNEQLEKDAWAAWEKAVEECEKRTNFHSVNAGEGKAACEGYRDSVWDAFIHLKYQYTAREKTARTGYILHDLHVDDNQVETVEFDSSEAHDSGDYSKATGKFEGNKNKRGLGNGTATEDSGVLYSASRTVSSTINEDSDSGIESVSDNTEKVEASISTKNVDIVKASISDDDFTYDDQDGFVEENDDEEDEEINIATPSSATITFSEIGKNAISVLKSKDDDDDDDGGGGDLHCTWNGVEWTFDGDPNPEFLDSEMEKINQDEYEHDLIAHVFHIYDHRTEGEIHINKRDLDLKAKEDGTYNSYSDANGDGKLEGAVYGLFAAEDIIHPDGKTGVVFKAGDLVSIATTDRNGDTSFMAITEATNTSKSKKNLYTQNITTELMNNNINIDKRTYQDNLHQNMNEWIGRPLILGRYYVKELSRSEGYELSVNGINKTITNFGATEDQAFEKTGTARFNGYKADDQYGEYQDNLIRFDIVYQDTNGYDVTVKGYPKGIKIYKEKAVKKTNEEEIVVGTHTEITNIPILAEAGEYILDENGTKIPETDNNGNIVYDTNPKTGTFYPTLRDTKYPNNDASVSDQVKYDSSTIDLSYLKSETQSILKQIGYLTPNASGKDKMPWKTITVSGSTNGKIIENLINELRRDSFYDSYVIDSVSKTGSSYSFIIRYGYLGKTGTAFLDENNNLYLKKSCTNVLNDGRSVAGYYFVKYTPDEYTKDGNAYKVVLKSINGNAVYGSDYHLENEYDVVYKTYTEGQQKYGMMIQEDGSYKYGLLFETKQVEDKQKVSFDVDDVELTEINATYKNGVYIFHVDTSDIDWTNNELLTQSFRIVLPNDEMKTEVKQTSTISVSPELKNIESGSYVRYKTLDYNSQHDIYSGDETRVQPIGVLERPIRQKVKVVKDIQTNPESEEYMNDTYSDVHEDNLSKGTSGTWLDKTKDLLTNLLNGDVKDQSASKIPGFRFKAYLKSNLERLYRDENGTIVWLDRNGNALSPQYKDTNNDGNYDTFVWQSGNDKIDFPEENRTSNDSIQGSNVQKIYTQVEHNTKSTTTGDISNNTWAKYNDPQTGNTTNIGELRGYNTSQDGDNGIAIKSNASLYSYDDKNTNTAKTDKINQNANKGYTRLLETSVETVEDGSGKTREVEQYNYEKFFDAMSAANTDKWDNDMYSSKKNYPGQHWFDTFEERYQKDDADEDGTLENTDGKDKDGTAQGDRDTSFKPFQWIREHLFGTTDDAKNDYPATYDNDNLENNINTSAKARSNAEASDAVRQFAIKWYLDDEVAKLVTNNGHDEDVAKSGEMSYQEEVYDEALYNALEKAYNYLKPFYTYDLDTMYSVVWDSASNGGSDNNNTTLSADTLYEMEGTEQGESKTGYYYGVSAYLPYGTYVLVEQQPYSEKLDDFDNKHYQIDKPKEIEVPSVYEENGNVGSPEEKNSYYNYNSADTPEKMVEKYNIRFNEEWANNHTDDLRNYVIRAHNDEGDYEIYKYGLDVDKLISTINYSGGNYSYTGWSIVQDINDSLKNYYNTPLVDSEQEGGNRNSHYFGDDSNKGKKGVSGRYYAEDAIEKRYHYGSISENSGTANNVIYQLGNKKDDNNPSGFYFKDNVKTMTGNQTAYEGKYASMLVPWSVTEPDDSAKYDITNYKGYVDAKFRNRLYSTKLRIEKLDSETGESLLHDDAIFSIYAASRYTSKAEIIAAGAPEGTEVGDVKFYMEDTQISGSKEFLEAMNARNIEPVMRGSVGLDELYTGIVAAGTPVCVEDEQIVMEDYLGKKTGKFKVYSTLGDLNTMNEEDNNKSYKDQNVGYLITPQPLGAGVYVLAETKAPNGYAKTKPIAVEVYSDGVNYYMNGLMDSKVESTIYKGNLTK